MQTRGGAAKGRAQNRDAVERRQGRTHCGAVAGEPEQVRTRRAVMKGPEQGCLHMRPWREADRGGRDRIEVALEAKKTTSPETQSWLHKGQVRCATTGNNPATHLITIHHCPISPSRGRPVFVLKPIRGARRRPGCFAECPQDYLRCSAALTRPRPRTCMTLTLARPRHSGPGGGAC